MGCGQSTAPGAHKLTFHLLHVERISDKELKIVQKHCETLVTAPNKVIADYLSGSCKFQSLFKDQTLVRACVAFLYYLDKSKRICAAHELKTLNPFDQFASNQNKRLDKVYLLDMRTSALSYSDLLKEFSKDPQILNRKITSIESSQTQVISEVIAREILDSRGNPTIEVDIKLDDGSVHRAAVPSGASTGIYEALELRDGEKTRFLGKGVLKACENVNKIIAPKLLKMDPTEQSKIDKLMVETLDGSKNEWGWTKSKLGANAILAVSLALCRAGAHVAKMPLYAYIAKLSGNPIDQFTLPVPSFNVINGGSHAGNQLALQEFMILPTGATNYAGALRIGAEVYHCLKKVIQDKYGINATNVGDEGGFAPEIMNGEEAIQLLATAINKSGHTGKVFIGMDCAASEFWDENEKKYNLSFKSKGQKQIISGDSLGELYARWVEQYPIISIEDPFEQNDFASYEKLLQKSEGKFQIVGDDLLVTNPVRVQMGIDKKLCNALLLKVNQIGTVTESIEAYQLARKNKWGVMVSHRSGETEDNFIADLVVGLGTGQIKTGAPCRSERLAKYNQLLRIEEELKEKGRYAGAKFRYPY